MRRPAVVLPTGAGKTVVFATLIKEFMPWADDDPVTGIPANHGRRVIVLAHRDELVDQAIAKIRAIAPELNVGKIKADENAYGVDVMVCSVQTLARATRRQQVVDGQKKYGQVGLIITDECHHAAASSYKLVYAAFPDALQLGVTATLERGDGVGLGGTWDDVVYSRSILNLISKGHLTDVRTRRVDLKGLDLGGVKTSGGDWQAGALGDALMEEHADDAIVQAYKEHAEDSQTIVFTPTVAMAWATVSAFDRAGVPSEAVCGETPREERHRIFESFRTGATRVLVNCMVLTEGFDAPWAEVAVIARPTKNASLYTQMVGRVLRPWPGKKEALVLDLVGASANKLRTLIDLSPGEVVSIEDGESLAEAVVREEKAANTKVRAGSPAFELLARDVDSFGSSDHAWARTPAGVMYVPSGHHYVFLWPGREPGTWDVCVAPKEAAWVRTEYLGMSIGEAMAWGEAVAEDYSHFSTRKTARWRRDKPSQAQLDFAADLGVDPTGMNRGELSAAMDRQLVSDMFDWYVGTGV